MMSRSNGSSISSTACKAQPEGISVRTMWSPKQQTSQPFVAKIPHLYIYCGVAAGRSCMDLKVPLCLTIIQMGGEFVD